MQEELNQKIADLDCGLEIWKLTVSCLKEQDVNAQVMDDRRMKILTANIKNRGTLESLPYVHKKGNNFYIISGHHRVKAANNAGLKQVYCLVDTNDLTISQITSKQIAHNELVGTADSEILGMLVKQMNEVDDIIASGLDEKFLNKIQAEAVVIDIPHLDFDWRTVSLAFLPKQEKEFEKLVKMVNSGDDMVGLANREQYEPFVKACIDYGKTKNVKSVSTVISMLTEIALKEIEKCQDQQNIDPKST